MIRVALLLLLQAPVGAPLSLQLPSAASVRSAAEAGDSVALRTAVNVAPEATRDALNRLLARSATTDSAAALRALAAARQLATAIATQQGDSFPLSQVMRFSTWTVSQRRQKVTVDSLRRAGNVLLASEGFGPALRPWRASLRRAEAMGDTAGMAAVLGNIGAGFYRDGALDSAATYYARAAQLARVAGDQRTTLNALGGMANIERDRGNAREAQALYSQTIERRARIGDARGIAADRTNLGMLAEDLGDYRAARASYLSALDLASRLDLREAEAAALVNLGQLASLESDYAEALACYTRALEIYRSLGYRADEALVLHSLGLLQLRRGSYRGARARLTQAASLYEETGSAASFVQVQEDVARASMAMGNPQAALEALDKASSALPPESENRQGLARLALVRGDLAVELNDYAAARRWYGTAEALARQSADLLTRAGAQQGQGYLLLLEGSGTRAVTKLSQAARAMELAGDRRAAALIKLDLAAAQADVGDPARAIAVAAEARDSLRRLGDPVGEAAALGVLAGFALQNEQPAAAESLYRTGLDLLAMKPAPGTASSLRFGLAQAEATQGRLAAASQDLRAAIRDAQRSAAFLPSLQARSAFLADKWEMYGALAQLEMARGRDSTAFEVSEQARARQFLDEVTRGPVTWRSGADTALLRREQDLRRAITELSGQLDGAPSLATLLRGPDLVAPAPSAAREALAHAEAEYTQLLTEVQQRQPAYADVVSARTASWRDVVSQLPEHAALLEYLITDSTSILFVVTRAGVRAIDLDVGRGTLASLVEFARGTVTSSVATPGVTLASRAPLQRLHQLLIQPAEAAGLLEGVQHLILVPHYELHYLPFAALVGAGDDGRYLVQRFDLTMVPSASVWLELARRVAPKGGDRMLAMAPAGARLPGSRDEVEAIGRLRDATVLIGPAATKQAMLAGLSSYGTLHLATYGVLNRRNPLFSYLELAPGDEADGRLEVHDIYGLSVSARLVILSACQTGLGSGLRSDVPPGDEWVSLSRAFLSAGAQRVVSTLWPVADRGSAELMTWFHAGVAAGDGDAAALAAAQRRAIADPRLSNPFFWSGFVLTGGL